MPRAMALRLPSGARVSAVAQAVEALTERRQARRVDAVVVCQQQVAHRPGDSYRTDSWGLASPGLATPERSVPAARRRS